MLTSAQRDNVLRLWDNHRSWSIYRVSGETGISWWTVKGVLERAGRDVDRAKRRVERRHGKIEQRNAKIRIAARQGKLSYAEIGRRLDISRQRVSMIVRGDGL